MKIFKFFFVLFVFEIQCEKMNLSYELKEKDGKNFLVINSDNPVSEISTKPR